MTEDIGHALCYHRLGSGRAGFASRRRLDRSSVLPELGSTNARYQPAIGATFSTCLVGLRQSLVRFLIEHDLRANASRFVARENRYTLFRIMLLENIDGRETGLGRQAVPEIDRKAD